MLLKLVKPFNPGDTDEGKVYEWLHIDVIVYNSSTFTVSVVYDMGNIDAQGVYTPGKSSPRVTEQTSWEDLAAFATAMSKPGEPALVTTQRLAYEFLINHRNRAGSVDMNLPVDPAAPPEAVAAHNIAHPPATTDDEN